MRTATCLLFFGAVVSAETARCETAWTYVPASTEGRALEAYSIADTPTDKVVTVVGAISGVPRRSSEPLRVFAVDLPVPSVVATNRPSPVALSQAVPEGARWPDAGGRILAVSPLPADTAKVLRNPWDVRIHKGPVGVDTVFLCGGIVAGGDAGPVAILNGHIVRQGDTVGRFGVCRVIAAGVVLERNGSYFVIPRGTRTTITAVDG
jgi:hypothetical protein